MRYVRGELAGDQEDLEEHELISSAPKWSRPQKVDGDFEDLVLDKEQNILQWKSSKLIRNWFTCDEMSSHQNWTKQYASGSTPNPL